MSAARFRPPKTYAPPLKPQPRSAKRNDVPPGEEEHRAPVLRVSRFGGKRGRKTR